MPYKDKNDPRNLDYSKRRSQAVIRWRRNLKEKIVNSLGGCCQVCGYNRCQEGLDLHHIDPSLKDFGFGKIRANPKSITKLIPEIEKCMLICANCHREYHAGFIQLPEFYAKFDITKLVVGKVDSAAK